MLMRASRFLLEAYWSLRGWIMMRTRQAGGIWNLSVETQ